jgi:hypothetical protein
MYRVITTMLACGPGFAQRLPIKARHNDNELGSANHNDQGRDALAELP